MRSFSRSFAAFAILTLTACSGGPSAAPPVTSTTSQSFPASGTDGPIAYGQAALRGAALVGRAKLPAVDVGVLVKMRDPAGLIRYAQDANDPHSARYHQFLTPDQIADRFGASQADYDAVRSYFASKGLATMGWRQRQLLRVGGSQAAMEAALGSTFGTFTKNGRTFRGLIVPPVALAKLPVAAMVGAVTYAQVGKGPVRATAPTAVAGYSAPQVAAAFDYNGAYAAGYRGAGVTLGIIGTGPILAADFALYATLYGLTPKGSITQVNVTGAGNNLPGTHPQFPPVTFASPPPTTVQCTIPASGPSAACNPEDAEAQLDTQQAAGLAPDANVLFYLGYAPDGIAPGVAEEGIQVVNYEVQQAISDNRADVLSLSYGIGELDDVGGDFNLIGPSGPYDPSTSVGPLQFATLAAMGVAVFVSSGDSGALGCERDAVAATYNRLCVSYPATDPNVVAVGGVNAPLASSGRLVGPLTGWGLQTSQGTAGSGGGISAYFPIAAYQAGAAGVSGSTRNTPDASLIGDSYTGVSVILDAGLADGPFIGRFGGTSVAAPEMAAMWATVLQACRVNATTCAAHPGSGGVSYRLGNPDPILYGIYANAATYAATFTDVLFGDNSQLPACTNPTTGSPPCPPGPAPTPVPGFIAGTGYDRVTGIGVPAGRALIRAVVGI